MLNILDYFHSNICLNFQGIKNNNFSGCYSCKCVRKDKQFPKKMRKFG